jgi:hypothetical protein
MPPHTSISRWIAKAYEQQLGVVTETLASAITKVSLSFDLWTSGTSVALLGVVAHFINAEGKPTSILLSFPRQQGRHTGTNIADNVACIIAEYGLDRSLGFFITDNASNNATCISTLADEFQFSARARWIRCSGHVLNLVAQSILFCHTVPLALNSLQPYNITTGTGYAEFVKSPELLKWTVRIRKQSTWCTPGVTRRLLDLGW